MRVRFTIVLVVLLILIGGLLAVTQILRVPRGPEGPPIGPDRLYRIQDVVHVVISRGEDQYCLRKNRGIPGSLRTRRAAKTLRWTSADGAAFLHF